MYTVLARKYRPKNFDEVCGQEHITRILKNAIKENRVAHAYLFSGPRGTGKTSVARIFAKYLNCEKGEGGKPCEECQSCKSISAGTSMDVLEIDGASNRGIDEIRNLRNNANLRPANSPFKIYIIDEVHMLTTEACNALLKTLEEPPSYVKFFFATTAPEKMLPTILSRCQKFGFRPFTSEEIVSKLEGICVLENVKIESKALHVIFEFSGGSLRDALSILDQLIVNARDNLVTFSDTREFLGMVEENSVIELLGYLRKRDIKSSVTRFHVLLGEGKDPALILDGFIRKLKFLVLAGVGQEKPSSAEDSLLAEEFKGTGIEVLLDAVTLIIDYKEKLRRESLPVILIEVLLFKLSQLMGGGAAAAKGEKKETGEADKTEEKKEKPSAVVKREREENIFSLKKPSGEEEVPDTRKEERKEKVKEKPGVGADGLLDKWDEVLSEVKKNKPTLSAALREGVPEKGEKGDEIIISFGQKYSFHKSKVEQPANKKIVEKVISGMAGRDMHVVFNLEKGGKEAIIDNSEVKKVVDFFNGEIVKTEE